MKWKMNFCMACLVGTAMVIGASTADAQRSDWSGLVDDDWANAGNWSTALDPGDPGAIPPAFGTAVVIDVWEPQSVADGAPVLLANQPVITGAADVLAIHMTNGYNEPNVDLGFSPFNSLTVDGGALRVLDNGVFMGKFGTHPASGTPYSPVDLPTFEFNVINGGTVQIGGITGPDSPNFPLPSTPQGMHFGSGTNNLLIDGPGSRLVATGELRYTGRARDDKNPRPGSGIVVSNGGYLQTANLRLSRLNGLDGLDFTGSWGPGDPDFTGIGSNAGFLDIVGPDSGVKVFDADGEGGTLLERLQYMIDVDGIIVADGGSMIVGITDTGDGGYLLTSVVPEPSSVALLGMALVGFVVRRRR